MGYQVNCGKIKNTIPCNVVSEKRHRKISVNKTRKERIVPVTYVIHNIWNTPSNKFRFPNSGSFGLFIHDINKSATSIKLYTSCMWQDLRWLMLTAVFERRTDITKHQKLLSRMSSRYVCRVFFNKSPTVEDKVFPGIDKTVVKMWLVITVTTSSTTWTNQNFHSPEPLSKIFLYISVYR